jgi:phosphoenolpyruvate synthase/pyruvate phosphate dikinase
MELMRVFEDLGRHDAGIAGGKGASLGEMTQAGIPVPGGFVVLSSAFERFLEETDLNVEIDSILHGVDTKAMHTVEHASETIQKLILGAMMPEDIKVLIQSSFQELSTRFVAVRSSATAEDSASAAWAGQLDSFLNTTEETLLKNVQRCWASLFTPRAIFYRFEQGLHDSKISVAVVVQKMVESEVSGIAFSVHPVTEDRNQLIIEAGFGLGEAIVSGQITPDSYVVEKNPRRIMDVNVNTQTRALYRTGEAGGNEWRDILEPKASSQVLTETQILELSELIIHIENHYGFPCDIEWAYEAGKFYIVQSRPITTLSDIPEANNNLVSTDIVRKLKLTECQIDWAGPFSLLHYSIAANGYFKTFNDFFGKNLSFVYISYHTGVATAYLPVNEYQELGLYLAEKAKDEIYRKIWIQKFKDTADAIREISKNLNATNFFDHLSELKNLYDFYTACQVASKTASNFLSQGEEQAIFKEFEDARRYSETLFLDIDAIIMGVIEDMKGEYSKEQLMFALSSEALDIVKGIITIPTQVLQGRYKRCGVYADENGYQILDEVSADEIESEWSKVSDGGVLKGNSAFPGKVIGICRVIKNYKSAEIAEGEILVTGMTDPNFVPLMKKAGAIVTDGGGLLCHAAIVARELQKPCVIGTKFGTKTFKDGDLVEVDADNGVVRVLEKKAPVVLTKYMSREHSLFYASVWNEANRDYFDEHVAGTNIKNMLFTRNELGVLDVYYDLDELKIIFDRIADTIEEKPEILDNVIAEFYTYWEKIVPYLKNEKKIETLDELKEYYHNWMRWWSPMAYIFVIPDRPQMSEGLRTKALTVREETQEYSDDGDRIFFEFLKKTYPKYESIADLLLPEEVYRMETLSDVEIEGVKARSTGYSLATLNGKTELCTPVQLSERFNEHNISLSKGAEVTDGEIKGAIASSGVVRGKVRLVLTKASLQNVQAGDIMVTYATSPDYVPAMKKCAGIITDEGGVVCHAAIVSRELKISCVVGTKIATQVLKDGDLVEVDADNGVVRILKRAEEKEDVPNLHDYQKLFQWKGDFSYFLNSFFMSIYGNLHALSSFDGEMWRSYLPLKTKERTLVDGVAIYGRAEKYTALQNGIFDGYESLKKVFDEVLSMERVTKESVMRCFDMSTRYYSFYAHKAFEESDKNKEIKNNLISFEALKLKGREQLNELALVPENYLEKLLQKIGLQFQCDVEDLKNLSMEEIIMIFDGAFPVIKSDILKRKMSYATIGQGRSFKVLVGEESKEFSKEFLKDLKHEHELHGQIAQKGMVRGIARVFRISLSEIGETGRMIDEMIVGEILIADTTAPEIISACKKASAIVTNQGGLLSHAAIISRELGIPCIVGTGYATEIIKDGDLVEVDADNGVVRIIERK